MLKLEAKWGKVSNMAGSDSSVVSIDNAWNSVALEERIELISESQAVGISYGLMVFAGIFSFAYGYNQPIVFFVGIGIAFSIIPIISSRHWRKQKPAIILSYLAVRSIARRYAVGFQIRAVDIVLITRGTVYELFASEEEREMIMEAQSGENQTPLDQKTPVWIVLFRGGVVILSEQTGGAKLESVTVFGLDTECREATGTESSSKHAVFLQGISGGRKRNLLIDSRFVGALYVFKKRAIKLQEEVVAHRDRLKRLSEQKKLVANQR